MGDREWKRLTDEFTRTASSAFNFNAKQNNVAYSTHAGIPWLRYIRQRLGGPEARVRFWPFDGWDVPEGYSAIVEVYPRLWNRRFDRENRSGDQHDAYSVAKCLSEANQNGLLGQCFKPKLTLEQCNKARMERLIFGVLGPNRFWPEVDP